MCAEYTSLVAAMKALTQGESPNEITLPMAENAWTTRPDAESWGVIALEFEAGSLYGDNLKVATAYEGSVDLYTHDAGWNQAAQVETVLESVCGAAWQLNLKAYEAETGLTHREYVFEIEVL